MECYAGKREQQIEKLLEKGPFFLDSTTSHSPNRNYLMVQTIRNMKAKGKDVLMFRHNKGRKHGKSRLPFFIIIFKSTQRVEAWNMLLKRFPQVNKLSDKWVNIGAPILDGLVGRNTQSDCKMIVGDGCSRCGGKVCLRYAKDFKKTLCSFCVRELRGGK